MRSFVTFTLLGVAAAGVVAVTPVQAEASWLSRFLHRVLDDDDYYYRPYYPYGAYYGRGGHDEVPHWHRSYTPFGVHRWYGRGLHDELPHYHRYGPYRYRGYSYTPWGHTRSYYPRYPYPYYPW